jgi:hypothetical protein
MKLSIACAEAEKLSIKHKTDMVVIVDSFSSKTGLEIYKIATRDELLNRFKPYVPIKCYKNGKEVEY